MADRSKLTLDHLRRLAKQHLGAGYSKLTKDELLAALKKAAPAALKAAEGEEPKAAKRVSAQEVQAEIDQLRQSTLKKKAEPKLAAKGAAPVTAHVTTRKRAPAKEEKAPAVSAGVARVKSALAGIAKEVEARASKAAKVVASKVEAAKERAETERAEKARPRREERPATDVLRAAVDAAVAKKAAATVEKKAVVAQPAAETPVEAKAPPAPPKVEAPKAEPVRIAAPEPVVVPEPAPVAAKPKPAAVTSFEKKPARVERRPEPATAPVAAPIAPPVPAPPPEPAVTAPAPRTAARSRQVLARATLESAPANLAERMGAFPRPPRAAANGELPSSGDAQRRRGFPAEPVVEGFFVARIAGRAEARLHHLTDEFHRGAGGELRQASYGGRRIILLPRDPTTLFLFWDLRGAQVELNAGERAVVRILSDAGPVRELEAAQLARGFYVEGLAAGATYHAEAWAVAQGSERPLDVPASFITLPAAGEPAEKVRFLNVPFNLPLPRLREFLRGGGARLSEREGELVVPMRVGTWREEGPEAWAPGLSGSGVGRWVRAGETWELQPAGQFEVEGAARVPAGPEAGARPSSFSLTLSGWGKK